MRSELKSRYPLPRNEEELRRAIESVCAEFGTVKHLVILPPGAGVDPACACVMSLDPVSGQEALKAKFKLVPFGSSLCFMADVDTRWYSGSNEKAGGPRVTRYASVVGKTISEAH